MGEDSDALCSPNRRRPKVLYVMGAGRSGSTILGVALGNCEGVFFAGELDRWLPRSGVPPRDGIELLRLWSLVRGDVEGAEQLFGGKTTRLERSSALFDPRQWPVRRRLRSRYRRVSEALYHAIERATGVTQIVDTSHYPMRARELKALPGVELYLLFLVRDPQSIVASLGREDVRERSFGMLTSNLYLWLTYVLSVFVFLRHPRDSRLFVRHEDFLLNPEGVLEQILRRWGSSASVPKMDSLNTGVPFHGNRLLGTRVVALERPSATVARSSRVTAILQLPWRLIFSRLRPAASA